MAGHLRLRVALVLLALAATNPLMLATGHGAPKPRIYATVGEAIAARRDIGAEAPRAGLPFQNETMFQGGGPQGIQHGGQPSIRARGCGLR